MMMMCIGSHLLGESFLLCLSSVFDFVSACGLVFVIVITTEASVDSMCHELSEYVWVCEASKVNNLIVLAVGPDGLDNKLASSGSDQYGSDKYLIVVPSESNDLYHNLFEYQL